MLLVLAMISKRRRYFHPQEARRFEKSQDTRLSARNWLIACGGLIGCYSALWSKIALDRGPVSSDDAGDTIASARAWPNGQDQGSGIFSIPSPQWRPWCCLLSAS